MKCNSMIRLKFSRSPLMRTQQRLLTILQEKFAIQIVEDCPDYIIGSAFDTFESLKYKDAVRILFTGENVTPDFNLYDYAIGFDHLTFGDRYLRLPLYCFYPDFDVLCTGTTLPEDCVSFAKRKFCSFVVSNGNSSDPMRTIFFKALCKYKKVDSAGKYLNNMGGGYLEDKRGFIADYKFNIAFENSCVDGYTTEKIMEPMIVNSIPIYWGNKLVEKDFNPSSFVNLLSFDSIQDCIDYIVELDRNDDKYIALLRQSWFCIDGGYRDYKERLWDFFDNIFSKPKSEAVYISQYGYQPFYRDNLTRYHWMAPYEKSVRCFHKVRQGVKKIF